MNHWPQFVAFRAFAAVLALTLGLALLSSAVREQVVIASGLEVTKTADTLDGSCDSDCSLREAIAAANGSPGADTITLPAGLYALTIAGLDDIGEAGDLDATDELTINGAGRDLTIVDGGGIDRVIHATGPLTLEGVTVRNGQGLIESADGSGGGVLATGDSLTINDSRITKNASSFGGGLRYSGAALSISNSEVSGNDGGDFGGGIAYTGSAGSVIITESVIKDNDAILGGGGVFAARTEFTIAKSSITGNGTRHTGGGIHSGGGRLTISDSEISDNTATGVSFDGLGGGIYYCCVDVSFSIRRSNLSGNEAFLVGGAMYLCCGGSHTARREIVNSTLSDNTAGMRGGAIESGLAIQLANSTVAGNSAPETGGLQISVEAAALKNTIIAQNPGGNCNGKTAPSFFLSLGHNLSDDDSCDLTESSDLTGVNPILGPMQDNGGPTKSRALLATSPAIDAGNPSGCTDYDDEPLTTDQRGLDGERDGDGDGDAICDIGAFELQMPLASPTPTRAASTPTATPSVTPTATPGAAPTPTDGPVPTATATPAATASLTPTALTQAQTPGVAGLPEAGGRAGPAANPALALGSICAVAVIGAHVGMRRSGKSRR